MGKVKRILTILPTVLTICSLVFTPLIQPVFATEFIISGNGDSSVSQINTQIETQNSITQENNASVVNNVATNTNTGGNTASNNLGETSITTGNAEQNVSVENSLNSSTSETPCCASDIVTTIINNASDSTNQVALSVQNETVVSINNFSDVSNTIRGDANTGGNTAQNNAGSVDIVTGNIFANSKIVNQPINTYSTSTAAGSGVNLNVNISNNGSGSVNHISANLNGGSKITANNIFILQNVMNWDLNSGNNFANGNVGNVSVITGNIFLNTLIQNLGNIGEVVVNNCCPKEADPPTPTPSPSPSPTPTPTPQTNNPPGSGNVNSSSGSSSSSLGGPGILGLSATAGFAANLLRVIAGVALMAIGFTVLTKKSLCKEFSLELQFYY